MDLWYRLYVIETASCADLGLLVDRSLIGLHYQVVDNSFILFVLHTDMQFSIQVDLTASMVYIQGFCLKGPMLTKFFSFVRNLIGQDGISMEQFMHYNLRSLVLLQVHLIGSDHEP